MPSPSQPFNLPPSVSVSGNATLLFLPDYNATTTITTNPLLIPIISVHDTNRRRSSNTAFDNQAASSPRFTSTFLTPPHARSGTQLQSPSTPPRTSSIFDYDSPPSRNSRNSTTFTPIASFTVVLHNGTCKLGFTSPTTDQTVSQPLPTNTSTTCTLRSTTNSIGEPPQERTKARASDNACEGKAVIVRWR